MPIVQTEIWFINGIDNVNWPPYRDWKADVSSVSPSSVWISDILDSRWRRANARNVSFSISVRWSIYIINSVYKPNFRVSLHHRRSTNVSSETNPQYFKQFVGLIWKTALADFVSRSILSLVSALAMCTTNCSHIIDCESRHGLYHCNCQAGFTGLYCDINVDECSSNPCVHGNCEDGVNRYDCLCNKGFWGTNCERKIDDEGGMLPRPTG